MDAAELQEHGIGLGRPLPSPFRSPSVSGWNPTTQEPTFASGTPDVTSYSYDEVGNLYTVTPPNGVVTTYTYDSLNRLDRETVISGATTLADYDYFLLADGQRDYVTETDAAGTITNIDWTYENLNRLVGEARDVNNDGINGSTDYSDTYTLDLVGNRLGKLHDAPGSASDETISYVYNPNDQLTTETSSLSGATTYTYDANGSQTSVTDSSGTKKYLWDLRNQMIAIDGNGDDLTLDTLTGSTSGTVDDSSDTNFTYDSSGVRTSEATAGAGGSTTYFLNDTNNPTGYTKAIEESTVANGTTTTRSYVLGNKVEAQSDATNGVLYLLTDGHGSTRALTSTSGAVIERYDYDAFGGAIGFNAANAKTTWLFGGDGIYDPASGWTYHLARWRDGFRFTSHDSFEADPSSPIQQHKYVYSANNPILSIDPLGASFVFETLWASNFGLALDVGSFGPARAYGRRQGVDAGYDLQGTILDPTGAAKRVANQIAGALLAVGQAGLDALNGVSDMMINDVNLILNDLMNPMTLDARHDVTFFQSPDWSKDAIRTEDDLAHLLLKLGGAAALLGMAHTSEVSRPSAVLTDEGWGHIYIIDTYRHR